MYKALSGTNYRKTYTKYNVEQDSWDFSLCQPIQKSSRVQSWPQSGAARVTTCSPIFLVPLHSHHKVCVASYAPPNFEVSRIMYQFLKFHFQSSLCSVEISADLLPVFPSLVIVATYYIFRVFRRLLLLHDMVIIGHNVIYFLLLFFNIYQSVFKGLVTNSGMKTRCNSQQVW